MTVFMLLTRFRGCDHWMFWDVIVVFALELVLMLVVVFSLDNAGFSVQAGQTSVARSIGGSCDRHGGAYASA
jgi:hypothetical protein